MPSPRNARLRILLGLPFPCGTEPRAVGRIFVAGVALTGEVPHRPRNTRTPNFRLACSLATDPRLPPSPFPSPSPSPLLPTRSRKATAGWDVPPQIALVDPRSASAGIRLASDGGAVCDLTSMARRTSLAVVCDPATGRARIITAHEGKGADVCHYHVKIASIAGCPTASRPAAAEAGPGPDHPQPAASPTPPPAAPLVTAISGCSAEMGSLLTAGGCDSSGGQRINIHGDNFHVSWADPASAMRITVNGCGTCTALKVESRWLLSCRLPAGVGSGHTLLLDFGEASAAAAGPPAISIPAAISYAPPSNLRDVFQNIEQYGVGGLTAEIREIYRRVFQSRSLPRHIVDGLGVSHVKGVLLHGPPRPRQDAYRPHHRAAGWRKQRQPRQRPRDHAEIPRRE